MSRYCLFVISLLLFAVSAFSQTVETECKQTNVSGKDVMADLPWRVQKTDSSGNPNGIPLLVYIKDADIAGAFADVVYIDISIKNADDAVFGSPIVFDTYSNTEFNSLFSSKSVDDAAFGVQGFDASLPVKDAAHTIQFTADYSSMFDIYFSRVNQEFWYFVFTIPAEKLAGFDDIIDIKVYFSLDWEADDELYFRVFRYDDPLPSLPGYERGDVHYHTIYTNNSAEYGCPLSATREMARCIGLDWILSTNHSCDYDNYGNGILQNWAREKSEIQSLNLQDNSLVLVQGIEASVTNSNDDVVHLLCYPDPANPYSLPYIGDGDGDLSGTDVSIDDALVVLQQNDGFAFAAHPFATGDVLSALVDGGIWNVNDIGFPSNGAPMPGHDVVVCNDLSVVSDLFSTNSSQIFKDYLLGGQIWNYRNTLWTTDESFNPWNVLYSAGTDPFVPYDSINITEHYNRLLPGIEVVRFLWKKGLQLKNANSSLQNYRFYLSAGTDAHGDFNYCNTNFVYGVTGDISDNALGKLSSLVYCPSGKGLSGENILAAMSQGHCILSDGPVLTIGIDANNNGTEDFICGDEVLMSALQYSNANIILKAVSSDEFGRIENIRLILGTEDGETVFDFPYFSYLINKEIHISLDSLIQVDGSIGINKYFYLRAELTTDKQYGVFGALHGRDSEVFRSYTNPIWIVRPNSASGIGAKTPSKLSVYPNPFREGFSLITDQESESEIWITITNVAGKKVFEERSVLEAGQSELFINPCLQQGVYYLTVLNNNESSVIKLIKE